MKKILITTSILFATISSYAQFYADDALRYSQYSLTGTARIQSMGGAQVAIGGDMGSFGINPAGLAFYRNSDFAFTGTFFPITAALLILIRTQKATGTEQILLI